MDFLPEVFEIRQVFFGLGGMNKMYLNDEGLIFEWTPDLPDEEPRKIEITPLKEEWIAFWNVIMDLDAWTWDKEYVPPTDMHMDGDIVDINILFRSMKIKTHCWCYTPTHFEDFYYALYELTDLHMDHPGGI